MLLRAPLTYDAALVDAVKSFQQRHGLDVDGVIGKATLAQLEVVPADRVRQIGLALERLRWTPFDQGPRMIVINIPEFVLRAYELRDGSIQLQNEIKVIVGKSTRTRTPLFDEDMRSSSSVRTGMSRRRLPKARPYPVFGAILVIWSGRDLSLLRPMARCTPRPALQGWQPSWAVRCVYGSGQDQEMRWGTSNLYFPTI